MLIKNKFQNYLKCVFTPIASTTATLSFPKPSNNSGKQKSVL